MTRKDCEKTFKQALEERMKFLGQEGNGDSESVKALLGFVKSDIANWREMGLSDSAILLGLDLGLQRMVVEKLP